MRAAVLACVLLGCAPPAAERCAALKEALGACFGEDLSPETCRQLSDTDVENLTKLGRDFDCAGRGSAIPIDGDLVASTCRLTGIGCVAALNPDPSYGPAQYPFLLVNGIDSSPLFHWSSRIVDLMRGAGGHTVFLAIDAPYGAPRDRARDLWRRIQEVRQQTQAPKVNLICHSLGGLDCRYLASPAGLSEDLGIEHWEIASAIASITTVSTAHHGTRAADLALEDLPDDQAGAALDRVANLFGDAFTAASLRQDAHLRASLLAISTSETKAFNALITDDPGIYYQSWAGYAAPGGEPPLDGQGLVEELCGDDEARALGDAQGRYDYLALPLVPSYSMVGAENPDYPGRFVPNDGLVTVASARWTNFRGCIPADHMEQLGQLRLPDVNVRTGFDVARFYAAMAAELAQRGF
ncbi:MAG: hypothetical protein U1E65_21390 [Myxococcota bacterium]